MESPVLLIVVIALALTTLFILGTGVVLMALGNKTNERLNNRLMQWRVIVQALTIVALLLLFALH